MKVSYIISPINISAKEKKKKKISSIKPSPTRDPNFEVKVIPLGPF